MTNRQAELREDVLTLPMARLGKASAMPRFRWQQPTPDRDMPADFGLSAEESRHGFRWGEDSILPYQVFEDYDRTLAKADLNVVVIENGLLRAVIAPSLGGRLLALEDLTAGRELVFRNPVFQPANLAALNAWFSGGIEWNGLIPGHSAFTAAPVFAGVRHTPRGPILRFYEFDRIVEASWQIDLFMPADAPQLYAHGRIVNPNPAPRRAYWWTNVAVPMQAGTRVLSPADYAIEHIWPGNNLGRCDFPRADWDPSYPEHWENSTSVFFRAPSAPRRFITAVDRTGYGLGQTSTAQMRGRKFFYFGSAQGGQHWMDYLSRPGEGGYIELQSGITPTQNQRFEIAGGMELAWTEAFAPLTLDPQMAHDLDYRAAVTHAGEAVDRALPAEMLSEIDAFLAAEARLPLATRFSHGAPWGARQERLMGRKLAEGLDFTVPLPGDFWDDLAAGVSVSGANLAALPEGVAVSQSWIDRLEASVEAQGESRLHGLMLATAYLDRGETELARAHLARSLSDRPSWAGHRLAALLSPDTDSATQNYLAAWASGGAPAELAVEIAGHLMATQQADTLKHFVDGLPGPIADNERIVLARAVVAANQGWLDELETLLSSRQFATIREGETLLSDLWVRLRRGRITTALKREPTPAELRADLAAHPLPRALDLRMHVIEADPGDV